MPGEPKMNNKITITEKIRGHITSSHSSKVFLKKTINEIIKNSLKVNIF